jgi:cytochrome c biogenesis protein CcmG/thiol:disulfide interchange protein DsbE
MKLIQLSINKISPATVIYLVITVAALALVACNKPAPSTEQNNAAASTGATNTSTAMPKTALPMPPVAVGHGKENPAQSFKTLNTGDRKQLTDYAGKVLVLDFWATYCPPCVIEAPHLDSMQKQFGGQGLAVVGLNVGGPDDLEKVPDFVKKHSLSYTLGVPDPQMSNMYLADDDRIPQTFVFSRKGQLLKHYIGFDESMRDDLNKLVAQALSEKSD